MASGNAKTVESQKSQVPLRAICSTSKKSQKVALLKQATSQHKDMRQYRGFYGALGDLFQVCEEPTEMNAMYKTCLSKFQDEAQSLIRAKAKEVKQSTAFEKVKHSSPAKSKPSVGAALCYEEVTEKPKTVNGEKRKLQDEIPKSFKFSYFDEETLLVPLSFEFNQQNSAVGPASKKRLLDLQPTSLEPAKPPRKLQPGLGSSAQQIAEPSSSERLAVLTPKKKLLKKVPSTVLPRGSRKEAVPSSNVREQNIVNVSSNKAGDALATTSTTCVTMQLSQLSLVGSSRGSKCSQVSSHSDTYVTARCGNETSFETAVEDCESLGSDETLIASEYNTPQDSRGRIQDPNVMASSSDATALKIKSSRLPIKNQISKTLSRIPSETLDYNGNTVAKKYPPLPSSSGNLKSSGSKVKSKEGHQEKIIRKELYKASSSSSLYSSCSSISVAETVRNTSIKLPRKVGGSRDRLASAPVETSLEEEANRIEEKQMEVNRKKQKYIQQKQEMQKKKNERWLSKVEKKKQEDAEDQMALEQLKLEFANYDGKKTADKFAPLMKGRLDPKLYSVVSKYFREAPVGTAKSCPDINAATAISKPRIMSQVESRAVIPDLKKFGKKQDKKQHNLLQQERDFSSQQNSNSGFLGTDTADDDDAFSNETTLSTDEGVEASTYDITLYEDLTEDYEYRENKHIPSWAANRSILTRNLYLQQPKLMTMIPASKTIFPKKPNKKLFQINTT